jgi:hypothetical protein
VWGGGWLKNMMNHSQGDKDQTLNLFKFVRKLKKQEEFKRENK